MAPAGPELVNDTPEHPFASIPDVGVSAGIHHQTIICTNASVIRNLILNLDFNPVFVYQFRIISTNPSLCIPMSNRYPTAI